MNKQHLKWAQQHDWGFDAYLKDGKIEGVKDIYVEDGVLKTDIVSFGSFQEMYVWAGY